MEYYPKNFLDWSNWYCYCLVFRTFLSDLGMCLPWEMSSLNVTRKNSEDYRFHFPGNWIMYRYEGEHASVDIFWVQFLWMLILEHSWDHKKLVSIRLLELKSILTSGPKGLTAIDPNPSASDWIMCSIDAFTFNTILLDGTKANANLKWFNEIW